MMHMAQVRQLTIPSVLAFGHNGFGNLVSTQLILLVVALCYICVNRMIDTTFVVVVVVTLSWYGFHRKQDYESRTTMHIITTFFLFWFGTILLDVVM